MTPEEYHREMCAFDEKIELAELEVSKARGRVAELRYMKARFNLDSHTQMAKLADQRRMAEAKPSDTSEMGELVGGN